MPFATFRGETSAAEIADKLFTGLTPAQREAASAAILAANPQLADIRNIREGTILRVPPMQDLRQKTTRSLENPDAQVSGEISKALSDYRKQFATRAERAVADAKAQSVLSNSGRFERALAGLPALQETAAAAGKSLQARAESLSEREKALTRALRQLVEDLDKGFG